MTALLGVVDWSPKPIDRDLFSDAFDLCGYYGGDESSIIHEQNCSLGLHYKRVSRNSGSHCRPVRWNGYTGVADAIIDNRVELLSNFDPDKKVSHRSSDSEIIFQLFLKSGINCVNKFDGEYAFCIWDGNRKELILSRDHIGIRPLYWRRDGTRVIFGTDIRSMHAVSGFSWKIDEDAVFQYLKFPLDPMTCGFFDGLRICPPGGYVTLNATNSIEKRWWEPTTAPTEVYKDKREYAERLRELLDSSIRSNTDSDLRIASHLSGGIDSSTVTVLAQRQLQREGRSLVSAYSWSPAVSSANPLKSGSDERETLASLAARENVDIKWGGVDYSRLLELANRSMEYEGTADLADELHVLESAKLDGVGLILSGWGGDEGFSAPGTGLPSFLLKRLRLYRLWRLAKKMGADTGNAARLKFIWNEAFRRCLPSYFPGSIERDYVHLNSSRFVVFPTRNIAKRSRLATTRLILPTHPNRALRALLLHGHLAARMETWAVWSAQNGFRYRYPLLSKKLLEFSVSLPPSLFMVNGHSRFLARAATHDLQLGRTKKFDSANEAARSSARRGLITQFARHSVDPNMFHGRRFLAWNKIRTATDSPLNWDAFDADALSYELFAAARAASVLENEHSRHQ